MTPFPRASSDVTERIKDQIMANERAIGENLKMSDRLRDQLRELRRSGDELRAINDVIVGSSPLRVQESQRPISQFAAHPN